MTCRSMKLLLFVYALSRLLGHAGWAAELPTGLVEMNGQSARITFPEISGSPFPDRAIARIGGKEISGAAMNVEKMTAAFWIDSSVNCVVTQMEAPLAQHLKRLAAELPKSAALSVLAYDGRRQRILVDGTAATSFRKPQLGCEPFHSRGIGDLASKMTRPSVDLLVIYTGGYLRLSSEGIRALQKQAKTVLLVSYIPVKQNTNDLPAQIRYVALNVDAPASQELGRVAKMVLEELSLRATVTVPLPLDLKAGDHRVELQFSANGVPVSNGGAYLHIEARSPLPKTFPLPVKILVATSLLLLLLGIAAYYRTPKCRKCGEAILRSHRRCFFCLPEGSGVLLVEAGRSKSPHVIDDVISVGSARGASVRVEDSQKYQAFLMRRSDRIFSIHPREKPISVNQKPVRGTRFVRSGDRITLGGWTCQLLVKRIAS